MYRQDDNGNWYDDGQADAPAGGTAVPYAPPPGTPGVDQNPVPYNPNATPGDLGGYTTAPPNYGDTGAPQPGWSQGPGGLWTFTDPGGSSGPTAPGPTTPGGTDLNPGSGPTAGGVFDWGPQFTPPQFTPPAPFTYGDFTPDTFALPTAAEAAAQPGYDFANKAGLGAINNSAAAAGVYRTGGNLKDLYSWANQFAGQNYSNVAQQKLGEFTTNENNKFSAYTANRDNAAQNYQTNYGVSKDVFDRQYQGALDAFRPKEQYAMLDFARQWDLFQSQLNTANNIFSAGAN